jgi:hypothetical protein
MNRQLVCVYALLCASFAEAQDIYSWKEGGVTHFASRPMPGAKKAELPNITKEPVSRASSSLKSCDKHGGINCSVGADTDGSVVCLDGFKDTAALFNFTCQSARLEFVEATFDSASGEHKVFVRNAKSVPAKRVTVIYQEKLFAPTKLTGPSEIAPYETGEFILKNKPGIEFPAPGAKSLLLACNNCG